LGFLTVKRLRHTKDFGRGLPLLQESWGLGVEEGTPLLPAASDIASVHLD